MFVREEVEKRTGDCYKVRLDDVRKNNGIVLKGLTVTQDDSNISPTIYLNSYYEEYIRGRATLINVVNDVIDTYHRNKVNQSVDMRYFLNYESVKRRIIYKLVNTEKNRELLEDVPHIEFLDLSIIFQCLVTQEEFGRASILIHNVHLKLWDVSVEALYQSAKENINKLIEKIRGKKSDKEIIKNPKADNFNECGLIIRELLSPNEYDETGSYMSSLDYHDITSISVMMKCIYVSANWR